MENGMTVRTWQHFSRVDVVNYSFSMPTLGNWRRTDSEDTFPVCMRQERTWQDIWRSGEWDHADHHDSWSFIESPGVACLKGKGARPRGILNAAVAPQAVCLTLIPLTIIAFGDVALGLVPYQYLWRSDWILRVLVPTQGNIDCGLLPQSM